MNDDDLKDKGSEGGDRRWWSDMMREATLTGMATFFMTEDSVRSYLKEKKLPKEIASLFLDGLSKKKDDLYALLAKEFGRVLAKIDLSREMARFLEHHKIHLEAKISFEPKKKGEPKTHIEAKAAVQEKDQP